MSGERGLPQMIHQSVVRQGNHFIRLPHFHWKCSGWILIDGPWWHYLNQSWRGRDLIELTHWQPPPCFAYNLEDLPKAIEYDEIIWQRIPYHPGTFISTVLMRDKGLFDLAEKWSRYQKMRTRFGYRLYPLGGLPAYLHHTEFIENEYDHDDIVGYTERICLNH